MPSNKTYKTAIVLIPPQQVWEPIQQVRRVHDKQFQRWMPHITLIYPFLPKDQFSSLRKKIDKIFSEQAPFVTSLSEFQYFRHHTNTFTIWLKPNPERRISELHESLWQLFPSLDDTRHFIDGFTPHLSVGQFVGSKAELFDLMNELQSTWEPIKWKIDRLYLIYRNDLPDDVFQIGEEIRLLGE